jgi:hypothetical protein
VRFADNDLLRYTKGYVPIFRTYPGARVPQPMEVLEHDGDTAANQLLTEILGLSKFNWNTADFSCEEPMSLAFARRVGEIFAEMPSGVAPQPEYRCSMSAFANRGNVKPGWRLTNRAADTGVDGEAQEVGAIAIANRLRDE